MKLGSRPIACVPKALSLIPSLQNVPEVSFVCLQTQETRPLDSCLHW